MIELLEIQRPAMRVLFVIFVLCVAALLFTALAAARHIRRHEEKRKASTEEQPASAGEISYEFRSSGSRRQSPVEIRLEKTMAEITLASPRTTGHPAARQFLAQIALAVAGSALVALCAHAAIPLVFTPVPLSLAPFAVLFLGLRARARVAFASLCLYLTEGAAGLPVFSPLGPGGILQLLGPDRRISVQLSHRRCLGRISLPPPSPEHDLGILSAGAASLVILLAGAAWLKVLTHMDIRLILDQAVLPFLPGDMLKVFAAAGAAKLVDVVRMRRQLKEFLSRDHEL